MSLIFGSTALKFWFPDFKREPKDLDVITKNPTMMTPKEEHYWVSGFEYVLKNNKHNRYVDPDFLYTIKVSHAAWDIWWDKTMHDIMYLNNKGCKLDENLYHLLWQDWNVIHRQKKINLNVKNEEFFKKTVTRAYEHDWLHTVFAFYDEPLHNRIRKDPTSALCSEKLWTSLSFEDKVKCALEEVYVIAAERFVSRGIPPKTARIKSLKLLITSSTKGWFNLFLIENFETLIKYDLTHYLTRLEKLNGKNVSI